MQDKRTFSAQKNSKNSSSLLVTRKMTKQKINRTITQFYGQSKETRCLRPGEEALLIKEINRYIEEDLPKYPSKITWNIQLIIKSILTKCDMDYLLQYPF